MALYEEDEYFYEHGLDDLFMNDDLVEELDYEAKKRMDEQECAYDWAVSARALRALYGEEGAQLLAPYLHRRDHYYDFPHEAGAWPCETEHVSDSDFLFGPGAWESSGSPPAYQQFIDPFAKLFPAWPVGSIGDAWARAVAEQGSNMPTVYENPGYIELLPPDFWTFCQAELFFRSRGLKLCVVLGTFDSRSYLRGRDIRCVAPRECLILTGDGVRFSDELETRLKRQGGLVRGERERLAYARWVFWANGRLGSAASDRADDGIHFVHKTIPRLESYPDGTPLEIDPDLPTYLRPEQYDVFMFWNWMETRLRNVPELEWAVGAFDRTLPEWWAYQARSSLYDAALEKVYQQYAEFYHDPSEVARICGRYWDLRGAPKQSGTRE